MLDAGDFPVVLGGDCSIVLGSMLALRRRGRHGLLFIDAHADSTNPRPNPPARLRPWISHWSPDVVRELLADLDGRGPLVRDDDVAHLGRRDAQEADEAGSRRIEDTAIRVIDLADVRERGMQRAAEEAVGHLTRAEIDGFWIHIDCDVLDDAVMPAVDYRIPGGLAWEELEAAVRVAVGSGRAVGLEITIFNPRLDDDGSIARALVGCIAAGLDHDSLPAQPEPAIS